MKFFSTGVKVCWMTVDKIEIVLLLVCCIVCKCGVFKMIPIYFSCKFFFCVTMFLRFALKMCHLIITTKNL